MSTTSRRSRLSTPIRKSAPHLLVLPAELRQIILTYAVASGLINICQHAPVKERKYIVIPRLEPDGGLIPVEKRELIHDTTLCNPNVGLLVICKKLAGDLKGISIPHKVDLRACSQECLWRFVTLSHWREMHPALENHVRTISWTRTFYSYRYNVVLSSWASSRLWDMDDWVDREKRLANRNFWWAKSFEYDQDQTKFRTILKTTVAVPARKPSYGVLVEHFGKCELGSVGILPVRRRPGRG